jgi:hypothetical protein
VTGRAAPLRAAAIALGALALVLAAAPARAEVHRVALIVGNNAGAAKRKPLRFAEDDALKLGRVLRELGGFAQGDIYLLRGRTLATLHQALAGVRQRVATWRAGDPDARVQVVFFFSGHSDGQAIELGDEVMPFSDLKKRIADTAGDVRLIIIDSCNSGSILASKGGAPGPGFEIHLADQLSSAGEALLTSSAGDEAALESAEIRASFFSNNLVSGLRGAADTSGDGKVTLAEAYQYAFKRTLSETSSTIYGPQHPSYDFRLSGHGDLVLTAVTQPLAALEVPADFDRILIATARDVVAEVGSGAARRIGVAPGAYVVRAWRRRQAYSAVVDVPAGSVRRVAAADLRPTEGGAAAFKGDGPDATLAADGAAAPEGARVAFGAALGAGAGLVADRAWLATRLSVGSARPSGLFAALELGAAAPGGDEATRERGAFLRGGYRAGVALPAGARTVNLWGGLEAGGGALWATRAAVAVQVAPGIGAGLSLGRAVELTVEGNVPLTWTLRGEELALAVGPRVFAGVVYRR